MPMPCRHRDDHVRSSTAVPQADRLPGSEYFTALSRRLAIALTSWRRSHATTRTSAAAGCDLDPDARGRGRGPHPIDRVLEARPHRHRARAGALLRLDQAQVEQVVDDAARGDRLPSPAAPRAVAARPGRSPTGSVSASTSSAPIGVFSSWLTFATKSRRTLSTRWISETSWTNTAAPSAASCPTSGIARSWSTTRRRAEQLQLRSTRRRARASSSNSVDAPRRPHRRASRAIALGRSVAEHLGALAVDDDDAVAQIDECGEQADRARWRLLRP